MKNYVFEILGTLNGIVQPHIYQAESYDLAKIYFKEYIRNQEFHDFRLFKIGEYKKGKLELHNKIFITSWENLFETKNEIIQEHLRIEQATKEKENEKQIEILFGGRKID